MQRFVARHITSPLLEGPAADGVVPPDATIAPHAVPRRARREGPLARRGRRGLRNIDDQRALLHTLTLVRGHRELGFIADDDERFAASHAFPKWSFEELDVARQPQQWATEQPLRSTAALLACRTRSRRRSRRSATPSPVRDSPRDAACTRRPRSSTGRRAHWRRRPFRDGLVEVQDEGAGSSLSSSARGRGTCSTLRRVQQQDAAPRRDYEGPRCRLCVRHRRDGSTT